MDGRQNCLRDVVRGSVILGTAILKGSSNLSGRPVLAIGRTQIIGHTAFLPLAERVGSPAPLLNRTRQTPGLKVASYSRFAGFVVVPSCPIPTLVLLLRLNIASAMVLMADGGAFDLVPDCAIFADTHWESDQRLGT